MVSDALMSIASIGTKTATFSSAALTLPKSTMLQPLFARVIYTNASNASGSNSVTLDIDVSYDNGSTWQELAGAPPIILSTTVQSGEISIPFQITRPDLINQQTVAPQVRLTGTFAGGGSTPTITLGTVEFTPGRI